MPGTRYVPPTGDEPLDAIEQAFVRMFVRVIGREIREAGSIDAWLEAADDQQREADALDRRLG